jgi:hypothetical protein
VYDQQQPWGTPQPGAHPPPGTPQGGGAVAVTLKFNPLAFLLGLFKPVVELNGRQVANAWGRTVVPVPAGQHHLHVHVPYLLPSRIGVADLGVTVQPGQTVELEYRAPMVAFMRGALGAPPQKYPGMAFTIALFVVLAVIFLCICGGILVAAMNSNTTSMADVSGLVGALLRVDSGG